MQKIWSWCRAHPWLVSLGAAAATGLALHLFLNARAEQRWQRYAAEARTRGVKLMLTEFARPPVPDDQNFAALPMLHAVFANGATSPFAYPTTAQTPPRLGDVLKNEPIDWTTWQRYFQEAGFISKVTENPVGDTLRALDHYAPQFKEWSQWRQRPHCRFALDLEAGTAMPLHHLTAFLDAAKVFGLQLRAHLAAGRKTSARRHLALRSRHGACPRSLTPGARVAEGARPA